MSRGRVQRVRKPRRVNLTVRWLQNTKDIKKGTVYISASVRLFGVRWAYTLPLEVDLNGLVEDIKRKVREFKARHARK